MFIGRGMQSAGGDCAVKGSAALVGADHLTDAFSVFLFLGQLRR